MASGAPASDYIVSGEEVKWQGKPAAIIILGKGLLLTALAMIYMICMVFFYNHDSENYLAIGIALLVCIIMVVTERRFGLIGGLGGIAIAVWAFLDGNGIDWYLFLIPLVFALICLVINYMYLSRVLFVITDRRIITRYGIFTLRYADIGVEKVQSVTTIQPWYERIFRYGDVFFATAGEKGGIDYESPGIKLMSGGAVYWENVGRPFEVTKIASAIIHAGGMPVKVVNQPAEPSAKQKFGDLEELRQKGLISQEEYEKERKEILDEM